MIKHIMYITITIIMWFTVILSTIWFSWFMLFVAEDRSLIDVASYLPPLANIIGLSALAMFLITWFVRELIKPDEK